MKTKKIIAIASAVILAVSSLAGCGSNNKKVEEGNITLTAYDKNVTTSFGNDDVSSEIIKKTGVTLDYNQASGDAKEKLNLMLASNDYPDLILIDRSSGMIDKFISAKALIPLEDLIEEYAPNIKEQYGEYLNRSKSEDGHIYGLPNWYGIDEEPVLAFMIRKDYLSEVAPEEPTATVEPSETTAPTAKQKKLTVETGNAVTVKVDSTDVVFPDAQPFVDENGRTQVPIRAVSEMLDCKVDWDDTSKTATITKENGDVVKVTLGSDVLTVNNKSSQMDTTAIIKDDRTFIPVRFVAEALGLEVEWLE